MPPSTSLCRPKGLIFPDMVKKGTRGFHFPRGLRTHRYSCVALRALMKSQPSKLSQPSQPSQPSLILHSTFFIFRGVYTPIAIVVTGLLAEVKG